MVTIPFLPKPSLLAYVRTQLLEAEDGALGPFASALDLDVGFVHAAAAVDRVVVCGLDIQQGMVEVYYRVDCSVMDGRTGVEPASLDRTVTGFRGNKGWTFKKVVRHHRCEALHAGSLRQAGF